MRIVDIPARWIEVLAGLFSDWHTSWLSRRSLTVTQEDGCFVVRRGRDGHEGFVANIAVGTRPPEKIAQALSNRFVVFELAADKVVTRHLTVPAQAREFLAGIVGNQIERLSPWRPAQAVYGFDGKPSQAEPESLDVRVVIASRASIDAICDELTASGLSPGRIAVRADATKKTPLVTLWMRATSKPQGKLQRLPRLIGAGLAAVVLLSAAVSCWAIYSAGSIRAEQEEVSTRAHALQRQGQASRKLQDLASLSPAERAWALKETSPAAVLILEALTQALPDGAHLTELHLENTTLRIIGLAADAPSLIGALEQSGRISGAHFFAPTTKGPEGGLYRFYIEGRIELPTELTGG
jgi:general secretion pathway protein L